jgi:hypothetical protein
MKEGTKIAYFQWTLCDVIMAYGENFVNSHLDCTFNEFIQTFCKWYCKVYMNLLTIKQNLNERVEEYYEQIFTLANSLQHLVY